ncbi:penicillin acylase family protein [Thermus thermophilus]|uniref:Penicillin acylase n=2 Tax=Thermus thermophilus TaxID=274 RepID=Q72G76_THET2|nr:penicillin acylase [Thermus thermophilus HB27]QMV32024.1 penicillin acylase family protein [Thermus thermophilus]
MLFPTMKRFLRGLVWLLGLFLFLALLLGFSGYLYLRASLPQGEGRIALEGLSAPVEVVRDGKGVVRIRAATLKDLFFAQGFVHAQERLWQMEFQRRVGQGRLSEILGEATLPQDRFLRTWGFYRAARAAYGKLYPEEKEAVDAYAAGVNAFLASGAPLPPEFRLLGFRPEPWTGPDVLVWAKMMSYDLSGNWEEELKRHRLLARGVSPKRLLELKPPYPEDAPTVLRAEDLKLPLKREEAPSALLRMAPPRFMEASNNWVVAGSRTETGKPFLANDPHLALQAPSLWFLMALEAPGLRAIGATLPGLPGVVIGRNERIAWGVTNVGADVEDLYLLEEVEGRGYRYKGRVVPYGVREEVIRVKGGREEVLKVRETVYGPVITDALEDPPKTPMALRWVSLDEEDHILMAFLGVNRAGNWEEFKKALLPYSAPSQNFVYADVEGNIGYIAPGKFPVRKEGHTGMVPVPGNGEWDWLGYRRPEEWPQAFNPARGYLVTANHKVTPKGFPYALTYDWAEPYRAERIEELLLAKEKLSLEDMKAIQQDQKSLLYRDFRPVLELLTPLSEGARAWRDRLLAWDGTMAPGSEEALVFALWYTELTRLPQREVGEAYWDEPRYLLKALKEGDKNCDQPETEYRESCLDYAALALERALDRKEALGARAWGEVHRARFPHAVLTHTPLKRLSDREVAFGGDRYTVNVGPFDPETLAMGHGPSYRQIVDLSDMEGSLFVHPMGQSGHFLSRHYADLLPLWQRGDYLPMRFGAPLGRTLLLEPLPSP